MKKNLIKMFGLPLSTVLAISIVSTTESFANPAKENSTIDRIHFLDTIKGGDSIIIESNGMFAMVDSGEKSIENINSIKAYLNNIGAEHLDYFIATHMHSDHIGNAGLLMSNGVKVENIIATKIDKITHKTTNSQLPNNSKNPLYNIVEDIEFRDATRNGEALKDWESDILYRDMLLSFSKQYSGSLKEIPLNKYIDGIGYHILPVENSTLKFGDYTLKFNNAFNGNLKDYNNNNLKVSAKEDTNATSLFITVSDNKNSKFYLSGDGRAENIIDLFDKNTSMYNNVIGYKVSHHGANDSKDFIDKLKKNNPNIKMFGMAVNAGYSPADHIVGQNIPLYVTNPYGDKHNGSFAVEFYNGTLKTDAKPIELKWENKNNEWYLKLNNCIIKEKWVLVGDNYYYFNEDGKALKNGWHLVNDTWYYFAKTGEKDIYGKVYPECAMFSDSWVKTGSDWYYLNTDGSMAVNKWLKETRGNGIQWYYLGEDGKMFRGKHMIDGVVYYFAPSSNHKSYSGKVYPDGQMYSNEWLKLSNGKWNYFKSDGSIAKNEALKIDGVTYKFKSDGTY